jgi:hypothetical protein
MHIENILIERNFRLKDSDKFMHLTDHPKRDEILAYRQALRDFPASDDWPDMTKMPNPPASLV